MPTMVHGDLERLTAQTVYDAAKAGDPVADEIVRDTARYLGAGVANLLNIFNPDVVVVAGGVTQAGERLFAPLRRRGAAPSVRAGGGRPCRSCRGSCRGPRASWAPWRPSLTARQPRQSLRQYVQRFGNSQ